MSKGAGQDPTGTVLDPRMAPKRLKEGLVPEGTGIFLRVEDGADAGAVFALSAGGVHLVGREGADIALRDEKVSRRHAELGLYGPDAWVIRDLASTNGTFVNGRRVSDKLKLQTGDLLRLGDTKLRLFVVENTVPLSR